MRSTSVIFSLRKVGICSARQSCRWTQISTKHNLPRKRKNFSLLLKGLWWIHPAFLWQHSCTSADTLPHVFLQNVSLLPSTYTAPEEKSSVLIFLCPSLCFLSVICFQIFFLLPLVLSGLITMCLIVAVFSHPPGVYEYPDFVSLQFSSNWKTMPAILASNVYITSPSSSFSRTPILLM